MADNGNIAYNTKNDIWVYGKWIDPKLVIIIKIFHFNILGV